MPQESNSPFNTIESAQDFMNLLSDSIEETRRDIELDLVRAAADHEERREQALQLTLFKMDQLSSHIDKSLRLLNDLRTLRRLLFGERETKGIPANMSF
jgi:hypothetical protein